MSASPRSPPPLHRPRHQISRSISELSSPIRLYRQDHSSHARRERERDDRTSFPQASAPLLQAMEPLVVSKSEGVTPNLSPTQSRRASVLAASDSDLGVTGGPSQVVVRKPARDQRLRQEQQKAATRTSGLKKSLADLDTFATTTTRRLDDSFYSVLEKLGMLQATIVALRELAGMCRDTNATFEKESDELAEDINSQLDALDQFEDKESRIESLKGRIRSGRDKIESLSHRVDVVQDQIESWERADREWQERTRRRLKVIWVVTSLTVFVLLLLFISAQSAPADGEGAASPPPRVANEGLDFLQKPGRVKGFRNGGSASDSGAVDDRLRVFDEL